MAATRTFVNGEARNSICERSIATFGRMGAPGHLIDIAIFCDSDETHGHTVSYFADVKLRR